MRNAVWMAGIGLAVLVAAGVAAFALSGGNDSTRPPAPVASETPQSAAAPEDTTGPAAETQTQLAQDDAPDLYPDDRVLGSADAPVTMIEYASLTCPHCAHFHAETFPQIKANYIDKGLVRFVYRDFPLDREALRAALLARCVPEERYFSMLEVLFRSQEEWASSADPVQALSQIGRTAGLSQEKIDACIEDQAAIDQIILRVQEAESRYEIQSTPTFIIDGEKHAGSLPYDEFDEILKGELP